MTVRMSCLPIQKKLCKSLECDVCYQKSFASHEKSQFWSVENKCLPREFLKQSNKKFVFNCDKCFHTFSASCASVVRGSWCPYCSNSVLCQDDSCYICFDKSFASHPKAEFWTETNVLTPRQVFKSSGKMFAFTCDYCEHTFSSKLDNVLKGVWCPYCSHPPKLLCTSSSCQHCFANSFASHPMSAYWSKENYHSPRGTFCGSDNRCLFDCPDCNHSFYTKPSLILNGRWCPYCSKPTKMLCKDMECKHCFYRSFAAHPKAVYWDNTNLETPRMIFYNSNQKHKFQCEHGHRFEAVISRIVVGNWCPLCIRKTEAKLYSWLQSTFSNVQREYRFTWSINNTTAFPFRYDFVVNNIIIELDGPQHFIKISNWMDPEETQQRDIYKMNIAIKHGYSVVRILQQDVLNDKYDWRTELEKHIKVSRECPNISYLCLNDEYNYHKCMWDKQHETK